MDYRHQGFFWPNYELWTYLVTRSKYALWLRGSRFGQNVSQQNPWVFCLLGIVSWGWDNYWKPLWTKGKWYNLVFVRLMMQGKIAQIRKSIKNGKRSKPMSIPLFGADVGVKRWSSFSDSVPWNQVFQCRIGCRIRIQHRMLDLSEVTAGFGCY